MRAEGTLRIALVLNVATRRPRCAEQMIYLVLFSRECHLGFEGWGDERGMKPLGAAPPEGDSPGCGDRL